MNQGIWGAVKLDLRSPQNVNGIAADPQPDWSFDNLLSELDEIDKKLNVTLDFPVPFTKTQPRKLRASKDSYRGTRGFVMHVPDHEIDYTDNDSEEEADYSTMVSGRRFACDELYMSDDSENEMPLQCHLMDKVGLAEGALHELTHELQLSVSARLKAEMAERAKAAAAAAEKQAAEEAAAKLAAETLRSTAQNAAQDSKKTLGLPSSALDVKNEVQSSARNVIRASENALELERRRRQIYEELSTKNKDLKERDNQIVSNCTNQRSSNVIFATSRVIVLVTSKTEVGGFQNLHGLREGWAWLARFLNSLPANLYTAVALHSFLEMAGFTLYRRYRNQFEKLLHIIARDFLNALKEGGSESWSAKLSQVKMSIRDYIESNQFKKEPEGLQLRGHLESNDFY
ncbi:UNVERIFIED_CONTAM: protein GLE1 [Sesamum radiatum]|uniref:mRNA export factor GLE1 n=1 Tax=Sesamum radiatum TaxID=300843 RepID=A0AAW2S001_SESRA